MLHHSRVALPREQTAHRAQGSVHAYQLASNGRDTANGSTPPAQGDGDSRLKLVPTLLGREEPVLPQADTQPKPLVVTVVAASESSNLHFDSFTDKPARL